MSDLPVAPPPWTLRGDAHALFTVLPRSLDATARFAPAGSGARDGGLGMLAYIRYAASDVGPYDELMWVPLWSLLFDGRRRHSITKIYVSSEASVVNGRRNWGIPKELARFDVTPDGPLAERVRVSTDAGPVASFRVRTRRLSTPFVTAVVPGPLRTVVQELDGRRFTFAPAARGRLHLASFTELQCDPARFPDVARGRTLAAFALRDLTMGFPVPRLREAGAR